jgi:hypothetical protein
MRKPGSVRKLRVAVVTGCVLGSELRLQQFGDVVRGVSSVRSVHGAKLLCRKCVHGPGAVQRDAVELRQSRFLFELLRLGNCDLLVWDVSVCRKQQQLRHLSGLLELFVTECLPK